MTDQFRADALSCVGGYGRTSALDRLAQNGVLFQKAVTNSPECIPARFALATGLYPHQTNVRRNNHQTMRADAPSWIRSLAVAGYRTSLFGKTHFHKVGEDHDLRGALPLMHSLGLHDVDETNGPRALRHMNCKMTDSWEAAGLLDAFREDIRYRVNHDPLSVRPSPLGVDHHYDTYVGQAAKAYLKNYNRPEPWCCWVSFAGPHEPWDAPEPYNTMHCAPPAAIPPYPPNASPGGLLDDLQKKARPPDAEQIAAIRMNYAGKVTLIDEQIGQLFEVVKARGEYDQTLIVFTSDHGEMNGDHGLVYKSNFLKPALDIPLLIKPPSPFPAEGSRSDALVQLFDIGATVLDYAGCPPLADSNASSIRPILDGRTSQARDFMLSEYKHSSLVASARWKAEFDAEGRPMFLFDTVEDPTEQNNLLKSLEYAGQIARLSSIRNTLLNMSSRQIQISSH